MCVCVCARVRDAEDWRRLRRRTGHSVEAIFGHTKTDPVDIECVFISYDLTARSRAETGHTGSHLRTWTVLIFEVPVLWPHSTLRLKGCYPLFFEFTAKTVSPIDTGVKLSSFLPLQS